MTKTPQLPKRTLQHIIDTKAVRTVMHHLPECLLIRGLEERDYGIDLQVEMFDTAIPTGGLAMIQIKGTDKSFKLKKSKNNDKPIKFRLKTKTIEYAMLFACPFFLFYVSNPDSTIYFVHIQKYMEINEGGLSGDWRNADAVNFVFPKGNVLTDGAGDLGATLIKKFILESTLQPIALRVIEIDHYLRTFGPMILTSSDHAGRAAAIEYSKILLTTLPFFKGRCAIDQKFLNSYSTDLINMFSNQKKSETETKTALRRLDEITNSFATPFQDYFQSKLSARAHTQFGDAGYY